MVTSFFSSTLDNREYKSSVEKIKVVVDIVMTIDAIFFYFFQVHNDYCMAFDYHAQNNNPASATALTEAHNNYVQQLHAANGMIDQYYKETLPQLLQVRLRVLGPRIQLISRLKDYKLHYKFTNSL